MSMANVDLGRYKRIVQYFWDPEPKNDDLIMSPIWCLGKEYAPGAGRLGTPKLSRDRDEAEERDVLEPSRKSENGKSTARRGDAIESTLREGEEAGWPPDFLDDFESRFWFTYRSNFLPIKKSSNPTAASAMTLSVRLRSQLVDQGGFTSDTGWGCMIRSGQSLLANALGLLRLGRGM